MLRSFIAVLATAALAMRLAQQHSRRQRLRHDSHRHHDDVSRWEAEGGNLLAVEATEAARRRDTARR